VGGSETFSCHRLRNLEARCQVHSTKAPPRAQVGKNLKNEIIINLLGKGAMLLGLQAMLLRSVTLPQPGPQPSLD
jgi:hypothetical protein